MKALFFILFGSLKHIAGALVRVSSNTFNAGREMIDWLTATWKYETFEQQLSNTQLPPEILDALPFVHDGKRLWNIFSSFVHNYLLLFYSEDASGRQESLQLPADDEELVAFWEKADSAAIQSRRLGLPELNFATLADYLTHAMFTLTGVHEMLGHILIDMMLPTTTGPRIQEPHFFGSETGRVPQSTVQDYCRMLAIAASVATVPMPMLMTEIDRISDAHSGKAGQHSEAIRKIYQNLGNELSALADEIDRLNSSRDTPFGAFNPRVLECSASL